MNLEAIVRGELPACASKLSALLVNGQIEQEAFDAICGALVRDIEKLREGYDEVAPASLDSDVDSVEGSESSDVDILSDADCGEWTAALTSNESHMHSAQQSQQPAVNTPTDQVLSTVELLEKILANLPITRILFAQRVSKHWRDIIQGSITLQRELFYTRVADVDEHDNSLPLKFSSSALLVRYMLAGAQHVPGANPKSVVRAVLNPILSHSIVGGTVGHRVCRKAPQNGNLLASINYGELAMIDVNILQDWLQSDGFVAAYGDMFLTQPPTPWVCFEVSYSFRGTVERKAGVRLRDVLSEVPERCMHGCLRSFDRGDPGGEYGIRLSFPSACFGPQPGVLFATADEWAHIKAVASADG